MKTVVVGIDGGEWNVIDPLVASGELPNLAELMETGSHGELESVVPPISPPAWNSINCGVNPGKHGIYDFSRFDESYTLTHVTAADRQATPFWTVLNDNDVSTGLFKVPFTYPPEPVDGFVVSGFPTPTEAKDYAHPQSLVESLGQAGRHFEDWSKLHSGNLTGFRDDLIEVAQEQTETFLDLVDEYDTDLLMTVYDGADRMQHFFWKYFDESHSSYEPDAELAEAIPDYYRAVDEAIGEILAAVDEECDVVVLSDHGFGPLGYDIYVNEWLDREGYLPRSGTDGQMPLSARITSAVVSFTWRRIVETGLDDIVKSVLPGRMTDAGKSMMGDQERVGVNWDEASAFFTTLSGQGIRINLEESFSRGTVSADEYDDLVERLRSELLELTDPRTGEPVIDRIHRPDEIYDGWATDEAPDLLIIPKPEYQPKPERSEDIITPATQYDQDRNGDHRPEGIFIASGPSFGTGQCKGATVLDIAPTLLHLHGCPIPESMDGSPLTSTFTEPFRENREVETTTAFGRHERGEGGLSEEEDEELQEQLEKMGYL